MRDFSLDVDAGELVTLLGSSGCGKTTVLRTLAGLETADSGDIRLNGRPIQALPPHRRRIGMVFQNYALFPHLSVSRTSPIRCASGGPPTMRSVAPSSPHCPRSDSKSSPRACRGNFPVDSNNASRLHERS